MALGAEGAAGMPWRSVRLLGILGVITPGSYCNKHQLFPDSINVPSTSTASYHLALRIRAVIDDGLEKSGSAATGQYHPVTRAMAVNKVRIVCISDTVRLLAKTFVDTN